jgi:hypothetical protein
MSPDFGYLMPASNTYFMNTVPGLFLFDVPVGFALLWLFHTFVKWPGLSAAPDGLQRRLIPPAQGFSFGPATRFGLILVSLLVGSVTHVVWDSFTHEWGWMVEHFALLGVLLGGTPLYAILQTLGTLLGICLLVYWVFRWLPTAPQSDPLPARFPGKVRALFLAVTAVSLAAVEGTAIFFHFGPGAQLVHVHGLTHGMTLAGVLIVSFYAGVYCLAWMITFKRTIWSVS